MSKIRIFILYAIVIGLVFVFHGRARAQSFHKGALMISLSEGTTHTIYNTHSTVITNDGGHPTHINGDRDPLTVEFGLTNHIGLGLNMGTDIIKVNPETFYGFKTAKGTVNAFMSEFTIDANYHFFNTKHTDLSAFISLGASSVTIKGNDGVNGNDGNFSYQYNAGGGIARVGAKVKYYFRNRFGVMAMLSTYAANCSPKGIKGNTAGNEYATSIKGWALEFGPCFRFF